ncbi:hypothetical protein KP509_20G015600 [Ceratopteris richardii]|uniref:Plant heme peroxidase family profile domain-containing protein n=1 Tax=Ceratopteris richardii TaxID=49495 RepID=A0A8T2SGS7_CERRI|nr:hypothetical protein KP509_20G015600 [Ceratopteris richardii]
MRPNVPTWRILSKQRWKPTSVYLCFKETLFHKGTRIVPVRWPGGWASRLLRRGPGFNPWQQHGCDASVLLDSTPGNKAEKDAGPNQSLRGFDVIDDIKQAVEEACPATVSCADIIAFATRDYVALAGGPSYSIGGGRLDSLTSFMTDANMLPSPDLSVERTRQAFADQGLSIEDMVALLGGHTVGFSHCSFVMRRLFNFQNTGQPDPSMN